MLHSALKINGKKVTTIKEIEKMFAESHFVCEVNDYALEVEYSRERAAFIGWLNSDEEIFYFDNGSGNKEPMDLLINVCPEERMMCYEADIIKDIVFYFCKTGKRNLQYQWIEEEF